MGDAIHIDGSYGEGGGQIIRTAVSLAALTGKPVEVSNVRAKRSRPGLQPQHLTAVRAAADLCAAHLEGAEVGSKRFRFEPRAPVQPGRYRFDIRTAGAAGLVAQTVLVPLSHAGAPSEVTLIGGTHVPHAPPADYLERVYVPALRRSGLEAEIDYPKAGFFPKGGGEIRLRLAGRPACTPLDLTDRGRLIALRAAIVTANLPEHVAGRGGATVEKFMKGIGRKVAVEPLDKPSIGQGAAVVIAAECENGHAAFTGMGERGRPMEQVAQSPCEEFLAWWKSGAAVDEHLADQLVLPLSLVPAESRWTTPVVTEHLRSVLWLTGQFLPVRHELVQTGEHSTLVRLTGAAFRALKGS